MTKAYVYDGPQYSDTAEFCPQYGRPREESIRVESGEKIKKIAMAKACLYCGLQLPDTAEFCPQCGRSREKAIRIEGGEKLRKIAGEKIKKIAMAKACLYCDLQLPDTAEFCPQCGRPRERDFDIRPIQEPKRDHLRKETMGKEDILQQHGFSSNGSGPLTHPEEYVPLGNHSKSGTHLAKLGRNTTGTLLTREFSSFQSDQPLRSRVRRTRTASTSRRRAKHQPLEKRQGDTVSHITKVAGNTIS